MTNGMTEHFDEAIALTQEQETECRLVEERTTKEQHVLQAFADSLAEFGGLYAELAKC